LLDELGHPILRLGSGPFSVDTLVHAEQSLGLDGECCITAPAAVRDNRKPTDAYPPVADMWREYAGDVLFRSARVVSDEPEFAITDRALRTSAAPKTFGAVGHCCLLLVLSYSYVDHHPA
jgi:hypothetical protein